jgi:hypothetical protein
MALFKTDYEEGRLQPTPVGHPQLATPRANHFLLVYHCSPDHGIGLKSYGDATWEWLRNSRTHRDPIVISPEEKQKGPVGGGGVEPAAAQARDAFAFGQLVAKLLNYVGAECEEQEMPRGIEEFQELVSSQLLNTDPKKRPKLSTWLQHVFFRNNNYCGILNFLETLPLKTSDEKENFFRR